MPFQLDYFNKLILVTSPDVVAIVQDIADFVEDQMASPLGLLSDGGLTWDFRGDVIRPEGKLEDAGNPGVFTQIILDINPDWQVQFWPGSGYTRIRGGKLIGGLSGEVMKATGTAGDITVLETQVDGTFVASGSGLSSAQDTALTAINTRTTFHSQIINNYREVIKIGSVWYLVVYDDGEVSGGVEILRKALKDSTGANISDLIAGVMADELANTA
jgi:hypothetical protein